MQTTIDEYGSESGGSGSDSDSSIGGGTGNDGTGSGGSGGGSGARTRGRPKGSRNKAVVLGELPHPALVEPDAAPKPRGPRKKGADLGALIDTTIVGLFSLTAVATGHEHWIKEREHVLPITEPLKAWVDQLPAKTLKKVESNLAPCMFAVGLAVVIGPDVLLEKKIRESDRRAIQSGAQGSRNRGEEFPPERANPMAGRNGEGPGNDWVGSIPPPTALNLGYDA